MFDSQTVVIGHTSENIELGFFKSLWKGSTLFISYGFLPFWGTFPKLSSWLWEWSPGLSVHPRGKGKDVCCTPFAMLLVLHWKEGVCYEGGQGMLGRQKLPQSITHVVSHLISVSALRGIYYFVPLTDKLNKSSTRPKIAP